MASQAKVSGRYPEAQAVEETPIFPCGEGSWIEPGTWRIDAGPEVDASVLGRGTTEAPAWADAGRRLRSARRRAGVVVGN
jgi:hypothetical protein